MNAKPKTYPKALRAQFYVTRVLPLLGPVSAARYNMPAASLSSHVFQRRLMPVRP